MTDQDTDWFDQDGYRLRFGWGPNGLRRLAPVAETVVIVDVLSFSTAVDVALGRGAVVLPYRWHDGSEQAYADDNNAVLASKRAEPGRWSLRPSSLTEVPAGTRLVLPSPNGSALAFAAREAGASRVMVGSLRNATAVAEAAVGADIVAVIAAGERWRGTTGPLRPAIEDLLGAGAVLAAFAQRLNAPEAVDLVSPEAANLVSPEAVNLVSPEAVNLVSPEARVAMAAFAEARPVLAERLRGCGSGRELIGRGFPADVELASQLDISPLAPTLVGVGLVGDVAQPPTTLESEPQ